MIQGATRTDLEQDWGVVDMGFHYPMTGPELVPSALIGGAAATVEIRNNAAGDLVLLGYSLGGGGPLPTPYGTAYIGNPYFLSPLIPADAEGVATLVKNIPAAASGQTVRAQGLNQTQGVLTNPIETTIQ